MGVVDDPNLAGLEESMKKDGDLTAQDLQARINIKREAMYQDEGILGPSTADPEVEPLEPPEVVADEPEVDSEEGQEEPEVGEEPEAEPEAEDAEVDTPEAEEEFFVGRYRTREAAEAGLAEKDRMIDQFFREREAFATREAEQQQGPQELDQRAWHEWAEEAVATGAGERGALEALSQGGAEGYDIYLGHWASDPEQAPFAHAFNNEVQRQFAEARAMQAVTPLMQREQAQNADNEARQAKELVAAQYPDFAELEETMNRLINDPSALPAETRGRLAQMASIGVEGKIHAWDFLYQAASASKGRTRGRAQRKQDAAGKEASDRAKIAATVSSAEGTQPRTSRTATEEYVLQKRNAIRARLGQPLIEE